MKELQSIILRIIIISLLLYTVIIPANSYASPTGDTYVIALDAGHGGENHGASANGLKEEEMTEATVEYMISYLQQYENIKVVKCPRGANAQRPLVAKDNNAKVHLSVHYNCGGGTGVETLYKSSSDSQSMSLAQTILSSVSQATGLKTRKTVERGDLAIISTTSTIGCPSVCLEGGFIDSAEDRAVIGNNDGLKKVAAGAVSGILSYLGIQDKGYSDIPDYEGYTNENSNVSSVGKGITETSSNEDKFLGLWKNSVGEYVPYYNADGTINPDAIYNKDGKLVQYNQFGSPVDNILGAAQWLSELLVDNERTQEHDKIMKYLMYVYTGEDYGVTEYDFSIFEIESFLTPNVAPGNSGFVEYLKAWEGAAKNAAGNYIVEHNEPDVPTVGYGVAVPYNVDRIKSICNYSGDPNTWSKGEELLSKYGITNEQIDKVKEAEVEEARQSIKSATAGLNLTTQQEDALIAIKYQFGNIGNFVEMYQKYGNTEELRTSVTDSSQYKYKYFESGKYSRYKSPWELKRSAANWKLFHEGIYTDSNGNEIKVANVGASSGEVIQKAQECIDILNSRGVTYGGGGAVPMTEANKTIDCSHYVSWVLYECGYNFGYWTSADFSTNSLNWQKIEDKSQLQPGDILVYQGHVDIYAGPGSDGSNNNKIKKYSAGDTNGIKKSPYEASWQSGYKFALRPSK